MMTKILVAPFLLLFLLLFSLTSQQCPTFTLSFPAYLHHLFHHLQYSFCNITVNTLLPNMPCCYSFSINDIMPTLIWLEGELGGGSIYHTRIPKVKFGKHSISIIVVWTIPGSWKRKGIWLRRMMPRRHHSWCISWVWKNGLHMRWMLRIINRLRSISWHLHHENMRRSRLRQYTWWAIIWPKKWVIFIDSWTDY